jgi:hypothetical protein
MSEEIVNNPNMYEFAFDKVTTVDELCLILSSIGLTLDQRFVDTHPELKDLISGKN